MQDIIICAPMHWIVIFIFIAFEITIFLSLLLSKSIKITSVMVSQSVVWNGNKDFLLILCFQITAESTNEKGFYSNLTHLFHLFRRCQILPTTNNEDFDGASRRREGKMFRKRRSLVRLYQHRNAMRQRTVRHVFLRWRDNAFCCSSSRKAAR